MLLIPVLRSWARMTIHHLCAMCPSHLPQANREAVAPVVVQLLKEASDACPPGAPAQLAAAPGAALVQGVPAAVLRKEAAYQAVATGAYELHDYVDFTGGYGGQLLFGGRECTLLGLVWGAAACVLSHPRCPKAPSQCGCSSLLSPPDSRHTHPPRLPARQPAGRDGRPLAAGPPAAPPRHQAGQPLGGSPQEGGPARGALGIWVLLRARSMGKVCAQHGVPHPLLRHDWQPAPVLPPDHTCLTDSLPALTQVYRALVAALGEEEDAAMQLAAVASLRALVDDW